MKGFLRWSLILLVVLGAFSPSMHGQEVFGPKLPSASESDDSLFDLNMSLGGGKEEKIHGALEIAIVLTLLTFIPSLLVTVTSFTRIVIVLGFVRRAMGVQEMPPATVVIGLSLFLTGTIMYPVGEKIYADAFVPYQDGEIGFEEAGGRASDGLKEFLLQHVREKDVGLFLGLSDAPSPEGPEDLPLHIVIPAFILSELKLAFTMGFVVYLPFLVIDMVIASILLSMGMMMLPPVMISTPFKILLFVMVDGWYLVIESLAQSFAR